MYRRLFLRNYSFSQGNLMVFSGLHILVTSYGELDCAYTTVVNIMSKTWVSYRHNLLLCPVKVGK